MDKSIATHLLSNMTNMCDFMMTQLYGEIMGSWPAQTFVGLYVVIVGYLVIMGRAGQRTNEWILSIFLTLIVGGIATSAGSYMDWVASPILDIAFRALALGPSIIDGTSPAAMFDNLENIIGHTMAIMDNLNVPGNFITNAWLYIKVGAAMLILALLSLAMYLAALALTCIALFSLSVMLIVGGPCLWLASFKETRHITWAWIRALANYTLWMFFIGLVVAVGMTFLRFAIADLETWDLARDGVFTAAVGSSMILLALTTYMLLKTSEWASVLTGGTASNTGIVGTAGSAAGGLVGRAANAAAPSAGSAVKNLGGKGAQLGAAVGIRAFSAMRGLGRKG